MGRGERRSLVGKAVVPRCLNRLIDPGFLIPWRQSSTCSHVSLPTSNYSCHSVRNLWSTSPSRRSKHFSPSLMAASSRAPPSRAGSTRWGLVGPLQRGEVAVSSPGKPGLSLDLLALPPHPLSFHDCKHLSNRVFPTIDLPSEFQTQANLAPLLLCNNHLKTEGSKPAPLTALVSQLMTTHILLVAQIKDLGHS